jgi:hypothetical protein
MSIKLRSCAAAGEWCDALIVADVKAMLKVAEVAKKLKVKRLKLIPLVRGFRV